MITRPAGDDEPVLNVTPFTHSFNFLNPTRRRHLPLSETSIFPVPHRDFHAPRASTRYIPSSDHPDYISKHRTQCSNDRLPPIECLEFPHAVISSAREKEREREGEREISRDIRVDAYIVILISDASRKMITWCVLYGTSLQSRDAERCVNRDENLQHREQQ